MPEFRFLSSPVPDRYGFQPLLSRGDLKALGMTNWKYTTLYPRGVIVVMVVVVVVSPEVVTVQVFRSKPSPEMMPPMFTHVFFITAAKLRQIFIHPKRFRFFYAIYPHFNTSQQKTRQHKREIVAFFYFTPLLSKKEKEENYSSSPCASSNKAFAPSDRPAKRKNSATRDKASFRSAP